MTLNRPNLCARPRLANGGSLYRHNVAGGGLREGVADRNVPLAPNYITISSTADSRRNKPFWVENAAIPWFQARSNFVGPSLRFAELTPLVSRVLEDRHGS